MARSLDIKRGRKGEQAGPPAGEAGAQGGPSESETDDVQPNEFYDNPEKNPGNSQTIKAVNIILTIILIGLIGAVVYLVLEPGASEAPSGETSSVREQLKRAPTEPAQEAAPSDQAPAVPTAPASPSSLSVKVLNGSGKAGAAGSAATTLRAALYNVTTVGNAKRFNYSTTTIFFKSGRQAEAEAAMKTLGISGATIEEENTVTAGVDLVIVIGNQ